MDYPLHFGLIRTILRKTWVPYIYTIFTMTTTSVGNMHTDLIIHNNVVMFLFRFIQNDMGGISRIGVMPRFGDADSIIWFDVENHCSYHLFNCFEDGNEVIVQF